MKLHVLEMALLSLLAMSILAALVYQVSPSKITGNAIAFEREFPLEVQQVSIEDSPTLGNDNAKVTFVIFSDYQCPFCAKFHQQTFPQIKTDYIDTGKVKFVHKDFPLTSVHPLAQKAAEAARCFGEQEDYFKYYDKLFENQASLSITNFKKWAAELGADPVQFEACLSIGKYSSEVQEDLEYGKSIGVRGTPAFFINGRIISGAKPYDTFKKVIDMELK